MHCCCSLYVCFSTTGDSFCPALNGVAVVAQQDGNGGWAGSSVGPTGGTVSVKIANNPYKITWSCDGWATQDSYTFPPGAVWPLTGSITATSSCCAGKTVNILIAQSPLPCNPIATCDTNFCEQNTFFPQAYDVAVGASLTNAAFLSCGVLNGTLTLSRIGTPPNNCGWSFRQYFGPGDPAYDGIAPGDCLTCSHFDSVFTLTAVMGQAQDPGGNGFRTYAHVNIGCCGSPPGGCNSEAWYYSPLVTRIDCSKPIIMYQTFAGQTATVCKGSWANSITASPVF